MLLFSEFRVSLLLMALVAHGAVDNMFFVLYVYVKFARVLVAVSGLNFNNMCLRRWSRSWYYLLFILTYVSSSRFNIMWLRRSIHSCVVCLYLDAFLVAVLLLLIVFPLLFSCVACR